MFGSLFGLAAILMIQADRDAWRIDVDAGRHDRENTPVSVMVPADMVPPALRDRPADLNGLRIQEVGRPGDLDAVVVQVEPAPEGALRLTFVLPGATPAGTIRTFRMPGDVPASLDAKGPWRIDKTPRALWLRHDGQDVFRYNTAPVSNPDYPAIQDRDAYIAPAFTPSGALITGDFSKFHPHHRGFFLAYTHTRVGAIEPDFWNIQSGTGKIIHETVESTAVGPVTARFRVRHRWEAKGKGPVLGETWDVTAYDIPGRPFWMFDLETTQRALTEPVELIAYRYGGMAYRGPEPFVTGTLDVLTDGGAGRLPRDQKPARWVDLTGPVEEGSDHYGGAMILDHPQNPHHPTTARIHPTTLPFFCYVPAYDRDLTIQADPPSTFRYRIVIHDGRPEAARNERLWRDFAEPPIVKFRRAAD